MGRMICESKCIKKLIPMLLAACLLCGCGNTAETTDSKTQTEETAVQNTTESEEASAEESAEAEETEDTPAAGNLLMSGGRSEVSESGSTVSRSSEYVFEDRLGEEIPKSEIKTITILDSLDEMPADANDVSKDEDGSVMMWLTKDGDYYDMYIAGEGGVSVSSGKYLFSKYTNVTSIELNGCLYTGDVTIMHGMFTECESLTELDLSSFDTSSVKLMSGMFSECKSLTTVDLSSFDTSNVENMDSTFLLCESLTELDLSSFDTGSVTTMAGLFKDCSSLVSLDVSGFDTSSVEDMTSMFEDCSSLISLDVSSFDTSHVTSMNWMFQGCTSLQGLDISGFDMSAVISSDDMLTDVGANVPVAEEETTVQTAYGEGTYYIFATRDDVYTSTNGTTEEFLSEQVIYFSDGELVYHVFETKTGKGSCGADPQTGQQYGYDVEKCEFYGMTVEQVIAALEEDGYTIVTAQTEWRYDEYDY